MRSEIQGRLSMNKDFDSVKFQREKRTELSDKLFKKKPDEIVNYFKKSYPVIKNKKKKTPHIA